MIKLRALVAKGHKNTNAPLIFENLGYYFFWFWADYIMGHFSGYFEGAKTFLTPKLSRAQVHSATCSCSDELYKLWYTLADF